LTDNHPGGTTPEPGAPAPAADQASEQAVATLTVADEPAANKTIDTVSAPPAPAAGATTAPAPATPAAAAPASVAPAAAASTTPVETPVVAPASETPAAAPAAETPAAETPAAETPVAETPVAAPSAAVAAPPVSSDAADAAVPAGLAVAPVAEATPVESTTAALSVEDTEDAPAAAEPEAPPVRTGPEPSTMEELLAEQDTDIKSFRHGDVVEGHVVRIDKDEILVDIGAKSEGVVSNRELYGRNAESSPALNVGDVVLVYVLQPESQEGHVVLSLRRAGLERKWRAMQEQFEAGVIIEAPVIDHNKGGLIVDCGIRGFVPISQIVDFPRRPQNDQPRDAAQEIAEKLQPFVGRKLRLKILEVNRKANRLILSEKVALYEERREKRDELFSSLQVGQKVTGTVRSIAPFGVFIDLGGIDGLVHKSELSWNKVNNPEAGYKVGEEVEAEVIDINHERGRISLSIRRLQPDPWHSTVADYNVGDLIEGTVTKLVNFGAFVRVRDGLEGLIHISELSHQRVAHPGDVVHEGQTLKLKIISLDSERHRLGLSLKQAEEPPARPEPVVAAAPRPERAERSRPRPERGYSLSDAVQEPEGGIDNTLAAAFAQVREQVAASEKAAGSSDGDGADEAAESTKAEKAPKAKAAVVEADETDALAADAPEAEPEAPKAEAPKAAAKVEDAEDAEAEAPGAEAKAAPKADAPKADAKAEAKAETPRAEAETPKAEAKAEPETPKAEAKAEADPAKADAEAQPKVEPAKADAAKAEAKAEAAKPAPAADAEPAPAADPDAAG
jgi:small subunit ribosomal protein S1